MSYHFSKSKSNPLFFKRKMLVLCTHTFYDLRLADIVEKETETWYKIDPDPFDDRHPGRSDPNCPLGHVLKAIFKNDEFMQKVELWRRCFTYT